MEFFFAKKGKKISYRVSIFKFVIKHDLGMERINEALVSPLDQSYSQPNMAAGACVLTLHTLAGQLQRLSLFPIFLDFVCISHFYFYNRHIIKENQNFVWFLGETIANSVYQRCYIIHSVLIQWCI